MSPFLCIRYSVVIAVLAAVTACAGAGKGAVQGAAGGAVAGAAGGLISSLIFGGDPGEGALRGAAVGATVGGVSGAIKGSQEAKAQKQKKYAARERDIEQYRRDIGDDAFNGAVALAECKHEVAIANANIASQSTNSNHALSGLWLKALTYADQGNNAATRAMYPEIIRWDRAVDSEAETEATLQNVLRELKQIRVEYRLPKICN